MLFTFQRRLAFLIVAN